MQFVTETRQDIEAEWLGGATRRIRFLFNPKVVPDTPTHSHSRLTVLRSSLFHHIIYPSFPHLSITSFPTDGAIMTWMLRRLTRINHFIPLIPFSIYTYPLFTFITRLKELYCHTNTLHGQLTPPSFSKYLHIIISSKTSPSNKTRFPTPS